MKRIRVELGPSVALRDVNHQIRALDAHIDTIRRLQDWDKKDIEAKQTVRSRLLNIRKNLQLQESLPPPTYMVHVINGEKYDSDLPALQEGRILFCGNKWIIHDNIVLHVKAMMPTEHEGYSYEITGMDKPPEARIPGERIQLRNLRTKKYDTFIYFHADGISLLFTQDERLVKNWKMYHPKLTH